ncbi:MAG: serine/threonine-protein phosphatase [Myxococcales bacterium]|nr:serine/threonine-protein phosphatase [Myxococcales bacterium]
MLLRYDAGTDPGAAGRENEDALLVAPDIGLFAVFDGVGGRLAGEIASSTAVEVIGASLRAGLGAIAQARLEERRERVATLLRDAFARANATIRRLGRDDAGLRGLCTTATALLVDDARAFVAHVGDSRIYRIRGGHAQQLSADHNLAAWARQGGHASESASRLSGLTAALGLRDALATDVFEVEVDVGDRLILCTDGLYAALAGDAALARLAAAPLEEVVPRAIAEAHARGGEDNVTVVVVAREG